MVPFPHLWGTSALTGGCETCPKVPKTKKKGQKIMRKRRKKDSQTKWNNTLKVQEVGGG